MPQATASHADATAQNWCLAGLVSDSAEGRIFMLRNTPVLTCFRKFVTDQGIHARCEGSALQARRLG